MGMVTKTTYANVKNILIGQDSYHISLPCIVGNAGELFVSRLEHPDIVIVEANANAKAVSLTFVAFISFSSP